MCASTGRVLVVTGSDVLSVCAWLVCLLPVRRGAGATQRPKARACNAAQTLPGAQHRTAQNECMRACACVHVRARACARVTEHDKRVGACRASHRRHDRSELWRTCCPPRRTAWVRRHMRRQARARRAARRIETCARTRDSESKVYSEYSAHGSVGGREPRSGAILHGARQAPSTAKRLTA